MRSSTIGAALFVAGAFAVPFNKRDYVVHTETNVVYVTDVVTVTAGSHPTAAPAPHKAHKHNKGNGNVETTTQANNEWSWGWQGSSPTEAESTPIATSTSEPIMSSVVQEQRTQAPTQNNSPPAQPTHTSSRQVDPVKAGGVSVPTTYAQIAVYAHNLHRRNHSAPDIAWSSSLAATAQKIANTCVYAHNTNMDGGGYGQNIAAGVKPANISAVVTDLFYNGEVNWFSGLYGIAQPPMNNFDHWGHMSQVVWKASKQVGCYTSYCPNGLSNTGGAVLPYFTVCNYKSPGNFANEYGINIGSPIGLPTASWADGLNINNLPSTS